jgi:hypothetical protein
VPDGQVRGAVGVAGDDGLGERGVLALDVPGPAAGQASHLPHRLRLVVEALPQPDQAG